jgi:hypothetical protein
MGLGDLIVGVVTMGVGIYYWWRYADPPTIVHCNVEEKFIPGYPSTTVHVEYEHDPVMMPKGVCIANTRGVRINGYKVMSYYIPDVNNFSFMLMKCPLITRYFDYQSALHYLLGACYAKGHKYLYPVGDNLLRINENIMDVKSAMIDIISMGGGFVIKRKLTIWTMGNKRYEFIINKESVIPEN